MHRSHILYISWVRAHLTGTHVLLDFSLYVKAATLIFISGCGLAISSAKKGNQVLFIIW